MSIKFSNDIHSGHFQFRSAATSGDLTPWNGLRSPGTTDGFLYCAKVPTLKLDVLLPRSRSLGLFLP